MERPALQQIFPNNAVDAAADTILPSQLFASSGDPRCEPAKRLMLAVLEEAIGALLGGAASGDVERRSAAREAHDWFASENRRSVFAFASICDTLEIDIAAARRQLAAWVERRHVFQPGRHQNGRGRTRVVQRSRRRR